MKTNENNNVWSLHWTLNTCNHCREHGIHLSFISKIEHGRNCDSITLCLKCLGEINKKVLEDIYESNRMYEEEIYQLKEKLKEKNDNEMPKM